MTASILVLTQESVGHQFVQQATQLFDPINYELNALAVNTEASVDMFASYVAKRLENLDCGAGVLILTDIRDSVADRIACLVASSNPQHYQVVTGLNLPMLTALLATDSLSVTALAALAISAGQQGIS